MANLNNQVLQSEGKVHIMYQRNENCNVSITGPCQWLHTHSHIPCVTVKAPQFYFSGSTGINNGGRRMDLNTDVCNCELAMGCISRGYKPKRVRNQWTKEYLTYALFHKNTVYQDSRVA